MTTPKKIRTVMLIDDEKSDQFLYKRIIERSGLVENLISYQYAEDALEYLQKNDHQKVDVIFLDINMPRMDGFEFLEAATEKFGDNFAKVIVIMLTTSLDPTDVKRANTYPAVKDFLNKPLTVEHLEKASTLV